VCETSGIDAMWRYCEGFRAGATYADAEVKTLVAYRDNGSSEKLFVDLDWGHTAAQDFIRRGADVIFAAGGVTGQGALIAAAEARVYAIGAEQDQAAVLPEARSAVVASIYGRASPEIQKWIRSIRAGQAIQAVSIGTVEFSEFREVKKPIPDSLKIEMQQLLQALSSGALDTKVPASAP
jgi:basic membrane protein A and related proteins